MKKLWGQLLKFIANLSLKKKLISIVTFSITLLSLSGLTGLHMISNAHLHLLEETVAGNLAYSTAVISDYLTNIEAMTGSLLADSVIQENLSLLNDSGNPRTKTSAHQALSYAIQGYYDRYKSSYVDYIALYHAKNAIYSNFLSGRRTPEEIENALLSLAEEREGRPVWMYEYAGEKGFYISRQVRDINSPYFRSLGVIIAAVDVDEMISSLNTRQGAFPDTRYLIAHQDKLIYHSDAAAEGIYAKMDKQTEGAYEILTVNGHKYFVYSAGIPGHDLTYTCYLAYDSIFHSATLTITASLIMILLTGITAFLFSQFTIGSISRHTNHLVKKMQAYDAENTDIPKKDSFYENRGDEFGLLNRQFDKMAQRIHNLIQDNYINELWKKDAQIKALEKQIQPHFLYNTLESINWRAKAAGNQDISLMVESLGSLLRASLEKDNGGWTLKKELEITDAYITIQKYRFEEHLEYISHCDEHLKNAQIPKFMIQPLVENAIHYGLEENMDVCRIEVSVCLDASESLLHIYVCNNGSQFEENLLSKLRSSQAAARGLGIGLINIDERIKLMFGPAYGLTLYNRRENAIAQITVPCSKTQSHHFTGKDDNYVEADYSR